MAKQIKVHRVDPPEPPSVEALAERDTALSIPRDPAAELLGDPPPSRSALARREGRVR